jgi:hypothetical protein
MKHLILFGTAGCHLCEEAEAIVAGLNPELLACLALSHRDIAGDDDLTERYGVRIPVLVNQASGQELGWPFDTAAIETFLQQPQP